MEKKIGKKANVKTLSIQTTEQSELKSFLIVILVVLVGVGLLFLATKAFVTKDLFGDKKEDAEEKEVVGEVNYDVTIMGSLLNRPYDVYYAVIYDTTGDYMYDMSSLVTSYKELKDAKHIYTIDLDNKLNESYYDPENVNTKAKKLNEVKVGDITLIKVKDGKINKFITDYNKMRKELGIE